MSPTKIYGLGVQGYQRPCEGVAGCDSFSSSISKTLTAATSSIQMDLAFGAGVAGEDESFGFSLFGTATAHYDRSDL